MSGWEVVKLGDVTDSVTSWNPRATPDAEFTYVDLSAIDNLSKSISSSSRVIGKDAPSRARQLVQVGDILVSTVRPNLNAVAPVPKEFDGATASTGFSVLRLSPRVDRIFLMHWVRHPKFVDNMTRRATGASYPAVSDRIIKSSSVPLPPVDEQRRIASILDEADAIRAKRRAQLARLDELPQTLFQEMFEASTLDSLLADHLTFLTSGSRGWAKYYSNKGAKFLRIQNVKDGRLRLDDLTLVDAPDTAEARRTRVQAGDIVLSITADLGRVSAIPPGFGEAHINQHLALLRAPGFAPEFLVAYLGSARGQHEILGKDRGATKAGLNFDDVRSVRVPTPPVAKQQEFATKVTAIQSERDRVARALEADDELFAALQHRAFRGEL